MEPAARDARVCVAAVPMPLQWLDVGSWPMFAQTCESDPAGNSIGAQRVLLVDTRGTLVASDQPGHLIATIGCDDLIIVHTSEVTLVCRKDCAESIKELYKQVGDELHGGDIIAAVGNSGGNEESGLYFELRHESKPLDPMKWLANK